jgi:elongation factor G
LAKQDPTFRAKVSEETGQTIISGMGELHLEVLQKRLARDFNLNVKVHKPRVSYRETVRSQAMAEGEFHRAVQGTIQRFGVKVRVEPFEGKEPITVASILKPDALPVDVARLLNQSVYEAAQAGGIVGYPLMHVKFTVLHVDYVEGESTEEAIRSAVSQAVYNTLGKADVGLLEPIMKIEVVTPAEFLGNIQADLNQRHARIMGAEPRDHLTALEAEAALSRMFGYSTQVRSLSQGRASYSMEPLKYDFAPQSVMDEMMGR